MKLTSPTFQQNGIIPSKYTCDGQNINPPLQIEDVAKAAKNLVIIVDDPDAPGGDFVHWLIWNIDPSTRQIAENNIPEGAIEGTTSFGKNGWGGPCPPSGVHRYQFKIYALGTELKLNPQAKKAELENAMKGQIVDQAILVGLYKRYK